MTSQNDAQNRVYDSRTFLYLTRKPSYCACSMMSSLAETIIIIRRGRAIARLAPEAQSRKGQNDDAVDPIRALRSRIDKLPRLKSSPRPPDQSDPFTFSWALSRFQG